MNTAPKLLPCPFCGNDVNDDEGCFPLNRERSRWEVRCGNPSCFAHEASDDTQEAAIARWNHRLAPPSGEGVELFTEDHGKALRSITPGEVLTAEQWESVCAFIREQESIIDAYKEREETTPQSTPVDGEEYVGDIPSNGGFTSDEAWQYREAAWKRVDRLLGSAYQAGIDGVPFDMLAARNAVHAALTTPPPASQGRGWLNQAIELDDILGAVLTDRQPQGISHATARVMLDSLDDFARMDCGVDAKGPRETLEKYIDQQERRLAGGEK